ncbi:unnamed protein product [Bubo scandiacus]
MAAGAVWAGGALRGEGTRSMLDFRPGGRRGILYKHLQCDSLLTFKLCYDVYKTLFDGLDLTCAQRALPVKLISTDSIFKQQGPGLNAMIQEFSSMIF